jgi:hypothetical protein
MLGAITYGAAVDDLLALLQGAGQTSPLGGQAPSPVRVRATAADGVTPVNGATIAWSTTNGAQLSACNGKTSCSVFTDAVGEASTWATPTALGQSAITAALAPASYSPAQTQQVVLTGTASTLDLAAINPARWIAQGATLAVPLAVEALDMGAPVPNVAIKFTVTNGTASLSANTASTNSAGVASVNAQVTNLSGTIQISACVTPGNSPCQTFTLLVVPPSSWTLEAVSGTSQIVPGGQAFQPLVMRVTDGTAADDPVVGVNIAFLTMLERNPQGPGDGPPQGDLDRGASAAPIILGTSLVQLLTDANGMASVVTTAGSLSPCNVFVTVTAGSGTVQYELESLDPITAALGQPARLGFTPAQRRMPPITFQQVNPPQAETAIFAVPAAMPSESPVDPNTNPDVAVDSGVGSAALAEEPQMKTESTATPACTDSTTVRPPSDKTENCIEPTSQTGISP